jgi:hypothetical protein
MASPYSFHERASPVSDAVALFFSASGPRPFPPPGPAPSRLRAPPLPASGPCPFPPPAPPFAYAFCSLAASFDSMVKMAS